MKETREVRDGEVFLSTARKIGGHERERERDNRSSCKRRRRKRKAGERRRGPRGGAKIERIEEMKEGSYIHECLKEVEKRRGQRKNLIRQERSERGGVRSSKKERRDSTDFWPGP